MKTNALLTANKRAATSACLCIWMRTQIVLFLCHSLSLNWIVRCDHLTERNQINGFSNASENRSRHAEPQMRTQTVFFS